MSRREGVIRFTVSLPRSLLRELDQRIIRRGYDSRSEFVRDLIREKLVEEQWSAGGEDVMGVLTISYDHHQRGLAQRLIDVQHRHHVNVLCTTHVHTDQDHCLEAIVLRGRAADIQQLGIEIAGLRGVRSAGLTRAGKVPH
jgi:CopG family nickel-responsive transcriptional regulator